MKSTMIGTPELIAVSTDDVTLPIANPSETDETVIKENVFINVVSDVRRPVSRLRIAAKTKTKPVSRGFLVNETKKHQSVPTN